MAAYSEIKRNSALQAGKQALLSGKCIFIYCRSQVKNFLLDLSNTGRAAGRGMLIYHFLKGQYEDFLLETLKN